MKTLAILLALAGITFTSFSFTPNKTTSVLPSADELVFPVSGARSNIGSFFGDSRSGGKRKHEGIDIFAKKSTPVVAVCDGYITAVENGGLGGKSVWLRSNDGDWSAYYAHLDVQKVVAGQYVQQGDILGTVGNTGNAKYTPSHLHFCIYTYTGAINPLPIVKTSRKILKPTEADPNNDNWARQNNDRRSYENEEYPDDYEQARYDTRSEYRMPAKTNSARTNPVHGSTARSNTYNNRSTYNDDNNNSGFPRQYIFRTVELNDRRSDYYITTQYNFVRVTNGKIEVLGRWADTDSDEYPHCIVSGKKILYYVDEDGGLLTPNGEEAGSVK
jgi:hypothetical protein